MRKNAASVTTKPPTPRHEQPTRKHAREWKIELLARLVKFAYDVESDTRDLTDQLSSLVAEALRSFKFGAPRDLFNPDVSRWWTETLDWCQAEGRSAAEKAAAKEEWTLTVSQLAKVGPNLTWYSSGASGHWEGDQKGMWLLTIKEILRFNQGWRIRVCAEPNCETVIVGRTTSRYCDRHSSSAEKVRRYRERIAKKLSPSERKERRRRYYDNWLTKHKGKAVAAVARRRRANQKAKEKTS